MTQNVKRRSNIFAQMFFVVSASLFFIATSCSDDTTDPIETPIPPVVETPEPIGQYIVNNDTIDILSGYWTEDDSYYIAKFSPTKSNYNDATTYFIFALQKELLATEWPVDHMFQNDDYIFVYETPAHLYSQFKKLEGGTLYFEKADSSVFKIKIDSKLYDGTLFKFDFEGPLAAIDTIQ